MEITVEVTVETGRALEAVMDKADMERALEAVMDKVDIADRVDTVGKTVEEVIEKTICYSNIGSLI